MPVTVAEFQENFIHYLHLAARQDVFIMQDGEVIAKLTQPPIKALPQDTARENTMGERPHDGLPRQTGFPSKLTRRENSEDIERAINSLVGVLPDNGMTLEDYRAERLAKYENFD